MMTQAVIYLALGGNLGDRRTNLAEAIRQLHSEVTIDHTSAVYETEPAYVTDQPNFYNMALRGRTSLSPEALLGFLKTIEQDLGRQQTIRYGPRLIDLDILLYDDRQQETPTLTLPHPRMIERAFVLIPLADIAPDLVIPGQTETVQTLAARLTADAQGQVIQVIPDLF